MRNGLARASILIVAALLAARAPLGAGEEPAPPDPQLPDGPLELGIKEKVDVQLVLVDFLALDGQGRTVPDLTKDELLLMVDRRDVTITSLDRDCPLGAADDALAGAPEDEAAAASPTREPRQIVLVFDYYHMENTAGTLEQASAMLDRLAQGDERHMVVSLGDVVRIESPFTTDRDEVRWALKRMRDDPDLYGGNFGGLTERRFFDRMHVLFDLLEGLPGRKTIVLFSGPFMPDGWYYDPVFKELSALSTTARTAVYPVDTGGLRTLDDPLAQPRGGPPMLHRLASETGGRMTADTNDITLAYARAHRDMGCTYTLGFHDTGPDLDRERRITIRPLRQGVRIVYPEFYVVRSPEEKSASLFDTASMAPHMFESAEMSANVFVLGPRSGQRWRTVFAVEIRPGTAEPTEAGEEWTLKGLLRKPNGTVVHSFERRVPMPASGAVTVFQEIAAPPGSYIASAIVSRPAGLAPWAKTRAVELSKIPREAPFLIGPILGHNAQALFEPLMVAEARQGDPLDSLTLVCLVGAEDPVDLRTIAREVLTLDGSRMRDALGTLRFESTAVQLPGDGKAHCHEVVDALSTASLEPGRYEITAFTETSDHITGSSSAEFTIRPAVID